MVGVTQVITIHPNGDLSGLQKRKGAGIDMRSLGREAHIERVSMIRWSDMYQHWFVDILQESGRGILTMRRFVDAAAPLHPLDCINVLKRIGVTTADTVVDPITNILYFEDYEEAVAAEIWFLDSLRLKGRL